MSLGGGATVRIEAMRAGPSPFSSPDMVETEDAHPCSSPDMVETEEARNLEVVGVGTVFANLTDTAGLIGSRPNVACMLKHVSDRVMRCTVVGYTTNFRGRATYIVSADNFNYAFEPKDLLPHISERRRPGATAALIEAAALAQLEAPFGPATPFVDPPNFNAEAILGDDHIVNIRTGVVFEKGRNLLKELWLSQLYGERWLGTSEELHKTYMLELKRRRRVRHPAGEVDEVYERAEVFGAMDGDAKVSLPIHPPSNPSQPPSSGGQGSSNASPSSTPAARCTPLTHTSPSLPPLPLEEAANDDMLWGGEDVLNLLLSEPAWDGTLESAPPLAETTRSGSAAEAAAVGAATTSSLPLVLEEKSPPLFSEPAGPSTSSAASTSPTPSFTGPSALPTRGSSGQGLGACWGHILSGRY